MDYWGVEDSVYTREVGAKWLIGAVARMVKAGTKIDWMLIVVGPQSTGKTTMPSILFKGLNRNLYGDHENKDLHMLLHSGLCVGFDELDSFGKKESSNLKAMITTNEDAFRPPYGASVEIFPRRFTLYGCGNRYEFLQHDPSGYRRYSVIEVARLLDFAGLEAGRDQLWAEAYWRYQNGSVKYWEIEDASEHAERYVIANPLEDRIKEIVEAWKKERPTNMLMDGKLYITLFDVQVKMGIDPAAGNTARNREMGALLRAYLGAPTAAIRGPKQAKQRYYIVEF
jgi:predicted P-loop ATPase